MIPRLSGLGRSAVALAAAWAVLGALPKAPRRSKSRGWSLQAVSIRIAVPARSGALVLEKVISIGPRPAPLVGRGSGFLLVIAVSRRGPAPRPGARSAPGASRRNRTPSRGG